MKKSPRIQNNNNNKHPKEMENLRGKNKKYVRSVQDGPNLRHPRKRREKKSMKWFFLNPRTKGRYSKKFPKFQVQ